MAFKHYWSLALVTFFDRFAQLVTHLFALHSIHVGICFKYLVFFTNGIDVKGREEKRSERFYRVVKYVLFPAV